MTAPTPAPPPAPASRAASPGRSWHWDLYARVLAGLRSSRGEQEPCTPDTLCAAEAVMAELAPITELLGHLPAHVPTPRAGVSSYAAGTR